MIDFQYVKSAILRMAGSGLVLPYGAIPDPFYGGTKENFSESDWQGMAWNPPAGTDHNSPDEKASPKPVWSTVEAAAKNIAIDARISIVEYSFETGGESARRRASGDGALTVEGMDIHVGDGVNHMTGLINMLGDATLAGTEFPNVQMRRPDNSLVQFFTQERVRKVVNAVTDRENRTHAAYNDVASRIHAKLAIAKDETKSHDDREKAVADLEDMTENFAAKIQEAEAAYDAHELPSDLTELRNKFVERLETAATGHQKYLKGALTQQAIDNWAQCTGIDDALTEVSKQCAIGSIRIQKAADLAAAQAAFAAAEMVIKKVTAVHTPVWDIDGTEHAANPSSPVAIGKSSVKVIAKHPAGQEIDGEVHIAFIATKPIRVVRGGLGTLTSASSDQGVVAIKDPKPGESVTITATARSLCGPSTVEIVLTPPEGSP